MRINPTIKGLITGLIMIAASLGIDQVKDSVSPSIEYLVFAIYAAGVIWTILAFARDSPSYTGKFSELFSQGFKCFIIVTLLMVTFTGVFIKMHPEFADQEAVATKEYYLKQGDKTPMEIEETAAKAKKQYTVTVVSIAIFRYLIFGAVITAATAVILKRRQY
jgi:Protein of unknown function (DUF4199)